MTDKLIDRNPNILGGTPVFSGTRVPVRILMERLEAGDRLDDFLDDYPTVSRDQVVKLLGPDSFEIRTVQRGTAWHRLTVAMDAMSQEAAANGLTPAALESLLSDES